jgi:hypothetical protein
MSWMMSSGSQNLFLRPRGCAAGSLGGRPRKCSIFDPEGTNKNRPAGRKAWSKRELSQVAGGPLGESADTHAASIIDHNS